MLQINHLHSRAHIISERLRRDAELSHHRCHNHQRRFNISCPTQTHDTVGRGSACWQSNAMYFIVCERERTVQGWRAEIVGGEFASNIDALFYGTIWCMVSTLNINNERARERETHTRALISLLCCWRWYQTEMSVENGQVKVSIYSSVCTGFNKICSSRWFHIIFTDPRFLCLHVLVFLSVWLSLDFFPKGCKSKIRERRAWKRKHRPN